MKEHVLQIMENHSPEFHQWIKERENKIKEGFTFRDFYLAFSMASRAKGGDLLVSEEVNIPEIGTVMMRDWSVSRLGRVYLLMALSEYAPDKLEKVYQQLFETAELKELVALYSALPFLPDPEHYVERGTEGVRTNIASVLEAVVLGNPYPAHFFPESAWNQMILKAVFTDKPLYAIQGIEERANAALALMLINYAKERWAAGRTVTPELWRPVGPFLKAEDIPLIERMLKAGEPFQQEAAVLAATQAGDTKVQEVVKQYPEIKAKIDNQRLSWDSLGKAYWDGKP